MSKITVSYSEAGDGKKPYVILVDGQPMLDRGGRPRRFATYAAADNAVSRESMGRKREEQNRAERESRWAEMGVRHAQPARAVAEGMGCDAEPSAELRILPEDISPVAVPAGLSFAEAKALVAAKLAEHPGEVSTATELRDFAIAYVGQGMANKLFHTGALAEVWEARQERQEAETAQEAATAPEAIVDLTLISAEEAQRLYKPSSWSVAGWREANAEGHRKTMEEYERRTEEARTQREAKEALEFLRGFVGKAQLSALSEAMRGEEKEFFFGKVVELADTIRAMPETYGQDGLGDQAIVHLHYFKGAMDWYVTEKDSEPEQLQAFGLADLGEGYPELGYIGLVELAGAGVELDLYWTPKTLAEIKGAAGADPEVPPPVGGDDDPMTGEGQGADEDGLVDERPADPADSNGTAYQTGYGDGLAGHEPDTIPSMPIYTECYLEGWEAGNRARLEREQAPATQQPEPPADPVAALAERVGSLESRLGAALSRIEELTAALAGNQARPSKPATEQPARKPAQPRQIATGDASINPESAAYKRGYKAGLAGGKADTDWDRGYHEGQADRAFGAPSREKDMAGRSLSSGYRAGFNATNPRNDENWTAGFEAGREARSRQDASGREAA